MSDRPIIFSAPMVRALLGGHKTMTRRLAWIDYDCRKEENLRRRKASVWQLVMPGDRLWVRENAKLRSVGPASGDVSIIYQADTFDRAQVKDHTLQAGETNPYRATLWTPSIHMPRWASRLTLEVTATKIERLQDISETDAQAEGVEPVEVEGHPRAWKSYETYSDGTPHPHAAAPNREARTSFRELWDSLHGPGAWAANPVIVALTFTVMPINIDRVAISEAA